MGTFNYIALDKDGVEQIGQLEASDARAAAQAILGRSLHVLELESALAGTGVDLSELKVPGSIPGQFSPRALLGHVLPIKSSERVALLRNLALMLQSGMTLLQSLECAQSLAPRRKIANALGRVIVRIQSGDSLSVSMEGEEQLFAPMVQRLVQAAEASGELDVALRRSAEHLERRAQFAVQLLTSLTYPLVVVLASILTVLFLVTGVVPKFAGFLSRRQVALPDSTARLVAVSNFFMDNALLLLAASFAVFAALILTYMTERGRLAMDRFILRVPLVGSLISSSSFAQISWTLSLLMSSGVTVLDALRITSRSVSNRYLRTHLEGAGEQVLRGRELSSAVKGPLIPPLFTQIVGVGERTGALDRVLGELGSYYEKHIETAVKRMSALVEPLLILGIGGAVGYIYFAFFQVALMVATK